MDQFNLNNGFYQFHQLLSFPFLRKGIFKESSVTEFDKFDINHEFFLLIKIHFLNYSPIHSKRQSSVRPGHSKNMFPSPKQQAKSSVQRSPSDTRKKFQVANKLSMVPNTKGATKMEECMPPEDMEADVKVEENIKEKKKKEEAKKWDQLKKKYGEQAAEETKDRWLKLTEAEKAYQEQKRIEEEKERRREEKLANILAIENNDYFDEDDDVFEEGDSYSDTASIESFQLDDADLEEFERDFERTAMMDIAKDVRDRLTSVSD